jgi:hypothetical protein
MMRQKDEATRENRRKILDDVSRTLTLREITQSVPGLIEIVVPFNLDGTRIASYGVVETVTQKGTILKLQIELKCPKYACVT